MHRGFLFSVFAAVGLAQIPPQQDDPLQAAVRAYQKAREQGRFDEAVTQRESARNLLDQIPADSPQLGYSVRNVAQIYQGAGLMQQAVAITQQALARAAAPDERIQLLQMIADFYQQEQNLLQAVVYREKAVAVLDEEAAKPAVPNNKPVARIYSRIGSFRSAFAPDDSRMWAYQQLADLYQQLGRPDAVAAITKRMRLIAKDTNSLAAFYQQHGQADEAAEIYETQAAQSDPALRVGALQSLANLYQQEQRYGDAADAYQQAIAAQNASGKPEQGIWLEINLAGMLHRAGKTETADQVYERLLAETSNAADAVYQQVIVSYANYLGETKRNAQSQVLLNDYLTNHPNLSTQDQGNLLMQLSNAARRGGDSKLAEEYQRAGTEKFQASQQPVPEQILIGKVLQAAQTAAQTGKFDEAFGLSLEAMGSASRAVDRDQISWQISNIATSFSNQKQFERAEQLYQQMLALVDSWSADNPQSLITALQNYSRYLMLQPARWNDVPAVIKRYREVVIAGHGTASGSLEDVCRLTIQYEKTQGAPQAALATVQEICDRRKNSGASTNPSAILRGLQRSSARMSRSGTWFFRQATCSELTFE